MAYTTTTFGQAQSDLAARLADPGMVRWSAAELGVYLVEALQVWSALTAAFHDQGILTSTLLQPFYDLSVAIPTLCGRTVADADLVSALEYALIEPQSGVGPWVGSDQFSLSDLTAAIQRRRDQFLLETGIVQTRTVLPTGAPPPDGRIVLPSSVLAVRRVAWVTQPEAFITPLIRDDEWGLNHFAPAWVQNPGRQPVSYSTGVTPPLQVQVSPPPSDVALLDLITVSQGPVLALGPTILGVPDDWAWVVKYGALADLLNRDGLAKDVARSTYCEARWQQGVQLAQTAPSVLAARINNVTCLIDTVAGADAFSPFWQVVPGNVQQVLTAGGNLIGLFPPPGGLPGGANWSIALDVVRKAPVPVLPGDFLQVGQDTLDVLYDYAQHVALFKEGPGQLQESQGLLDRFLRATGVQTDHKQAETASRDQLDEQDLNDQRIVPRTWPTAVPQVMGVGGMV